MISPKEQSDSHSFSKTIQKCISLGLQQHEYRNIPSKYIKISALDGVSPRQIVESVLTSGLICASVSFPLHSFAAVIIFCLCRPHFTSITTISKRIHTLGHSMTKYIQF